MPCTICASFNDEIVHGIPSPDQVLREGDIVSIDCGAILDGWHGDSAITVPVGQISPELQRLIEVTEESMWRGLAAARLGGRVSDISHAIEEFAEAVRLRHRRGVHRHGIGTEMHQEPAVPNFGKPGRGPSSSRAWPWPSSRCSTWASRQHPDARGRLDRRHQGRLASAHFEHTFTLTDEGPLVLTALDGGKSKLAALSAVG